MTEQLVAPPTLSTPESQLFENSVAPVALRSSRLSDTELQDVFEIQRTANELEAGGWKRIALQFPDSMLGHAPRIVEALRNSLQRASRRPSRDVATMTEGIQALDIASEDAQEARCSRPRLYILADTSYGACCVDEIAAEHTEADVVVHYGRSCLSPTARLPVIYVYTAHALDHQQIVTAFQDTFLDTASKIVLMADVTYSSHIQSVQTRLQACGYTNVFAPQIIHDPSSPLPNRTIPPAVLDGSDSLDDYHLFHISDLPPALLLTLSSRMKSMYIYPTQADHTALEASQIQSPQPSRAQTSRLLMRRYALLTSLSTCPIFGILVNTLSVKNYLSTITAIQQSIAAAGKKSYTFVVGKLNAAKVANFSEIGGWVVVGCWESSLIESRDFFKPIITPYELSLALQSDEERVWTGEWKSDFDFYQNETRTMNLGQKPNLAEDDFEDAALDSEDESAPPEFDLRSGRYVSNSRPMRTIASTSLSGKMRNSNSRALLKRGAGEIAMINGAASPAAEYLRSQRTWKGLGSDFEIRYDDDGAKGAAMEVGRSGIARGYSIGQDGTRR